MRPLPVVIGLLALLGPGLAGAEAQVATPFEVRKEAQELLDDLARRTPNSEDGALLERVQKLMARSGDRLIDAPGEKGVAMPLSEILRQRLRDLKLDQQFNKIYAPLAEQRLPPPGPLNPALEHELLALAQAYPATTAARGAWSRLADHAWDRGRLSSFIYRAQLAGDNTATNERTQRIDQARELLAVPQLNAPANLTGADKIWQQPLDMRSTPGKSARRQAKDARVALPRIALSNPLGDVLCGSDGQRAFVIDQLVGRLQGPPVNVGNSALLRKQCQPAITRTGFVVAGIQNIQDLALTALDQTGAVIWRSTSPSLGYNPLISAPQAIDQYIAIAMVVQTDDAADLRVQAFRQDNGTLAWDILVARLAGQRAWMFAGDLAFSLIPTLCVHNGRLLVLSNSGIIARIGADGDLQRVWTYRSPGADLDGGFGEQQTSQRLGSMLSDGQIAVATPVDLPGQTLIIAGDRGPEVYRGDGAGGEIVALGDGRAFLAGTRLVAVDLAKRQALWDHALTGGGISNSLVADYQAAYGNGTLLLSGRNIVEAFDPSQGQVTSRLTLQQPGTLGIGDQTVIIAADGETNPYCVAYGKALSVVTRLTTTAKADPTDIRSVLALASMATARAQYPEALAWYSEAFRRGAGPEYAHKAAALLRPQLDLATPAQWPGLLAQFEQLRQREPSLGFELTYWQARQAEALGEVATASKLYLQVANTAPATALIAIRDNLSEHLRLLATCGLRRLNPNQELPWAPAAEARLPALSRTWSINSRRGQSLVIGGETAVGYADGVLTANRVSDGQELWWRRPQRALLGVKNRPEQNPEGVAIDVMPGTSAAAAGLQDNDVLIRFNGTDIHSFGADLVPLVLSLTVRSPFTIEVVRGGKPLTLTGTLGGEIVEPVAANAHTVLVWPTFLRGTQPNPNLGGRPEGLWIAAHDLATGKERWRHSVPPATQDESPARPLLTTSDLVILVDGGDLVALPATPRAGDKDVEPVWRLAGQATLLDGAKLCGDRLLWLPEPGHDQAHLVDLATGTVLATLPVETDHVPVMVGNDLYVRHSDSTVSAWDLGLGRKRWTITGITRLAAAAGDTIWALNISGQLVALDRFSGSVRRLYGEWTGVLDSAAHGQFLYLHVSPTATTHALACISLAGGSLLWQQNLPSDVSALEPSAEGIGFVVAGIQTKNRPPEPAAAVALSTNGTMERLAILGTDAYFAQVRFLPGGLLRADPSGMSADLAALPSAPPPCASTAEGAALTWQTAGSASYAFVHPATGGIDLWLENAGEEVLVRLGQLGPVIDADPLSFVIPADPEQGLTLPAPLTGERLTAPAGRNRWRIHLVPSALGWQSGLPLQIRVTTASGSDCPPAPSWLRRAWRTVVLSGAKAPGK